MVSVVDASGAGLRYRLTIADPSTCGSGNGMASSPRINPFLAFFPLCQLHNRLLCIPIPCYECVPCETNPYRAGLHPCSCSH